jgi:ABC-type cobalamin/Fe3+-siderophores transport system ATPase subunit
LTLTLEGISFVRRGRVVLSGVSARVPGAGLTCVVGPNAAGKTTLLRILSGEWKATSGRYLIDGVDASRLSQREIGRDVSIIPQDVQPPPYLKVSELVALGRFRPDRPAWRRPGEEDLAAISSSLSRCRADGISGRTVEGLSGGEQKRAWLAFGLAQGKRFLLLDETLDGLDVRAKRAFFEFLKEVAGEGTGIVLATHDLHLVSDYADTVIILGGGKVIHQGQAGVDLERCLAAANLD